MCELHVSHGRGVNLDVVAEIVIKEEEKSDLAQVINKGSILDRVVDVNKPLVLVVPKVFERRRDDGSGLARHDRLNGRMGEVNCWRWGPLMLRG